jgi:hypothetical protein
MKHKIIFLIAVSLTLISSCDKIYENNFKISYYNFNPDIIISSVRDSGFLDWGEFDGPCYYPIPSDSSENYLIDLDADSILDFEFVQSHHFNGCEGSPHSYCNCFTYCTYITASDTNNLIFTTEQNNGYLIKKFKMGDTIYSDLQAQRFAYIYLDINAAGVYYPSHGIYFIGVKTVNSQQSNIGWIQIDVNRDSLIIKDLAYINEKNNFIIAGQTE